ncbi:hypothetical protein HMPREF9141_1136 [Prevotella multiformis DSM 16608]|uniref:Uncharacterized protein n=1 Tax=Prevotella multiformis DSM 16608 TaxID=888743 RepID=F0F6B4_9BACT|nr:hypothetical protein HMPREF9141_1136 [Prevotella multiformis DSM 16608]
MLFLWKEDYDFLQFFTTFTFSFEGFYAFTYAVFALAELKYPIKSFSLSKILFNFVAT